MHLRIFNLIQGDFASLYGYLLLGAVKLEIVFNFLPLDPVGHSGDSLLVSTGRKPIHIDGSRKKIVMPEHFQKALRIQQNNRNDETNQDASFS